MKKWIFTVFLISLSPLMSRSTSQINEGHCQNETFADLANNLEAKYFRPSDLQYVAPTSVRTNLLVVRPMDIRGFGREGQRKLDKAFEVMERVMNSEEFKDRIINFQNKYKLRSFASNNGLSNEQIYELLMEGREVLQQNTPGEINLYLSLYYKRHSKVIGWTNPQINTIHINWKFFKEFGIHEVAGNLTHEWIHKMGFGHQSALEHDSVPYAVGYIVRELGAKYLRGVELY